MRSLRLASGVRAVGFSPDLATPSGVLVVAALLGVRSCCCLFSLPPSSCWRLGVRAARDGRSVRLCDDGGVFVRSPKGLRKPG